MPSWCTLYKGLFTLVIVLIVIEYFFGTIIENKHFESVFTFNNSRFNDNNRNIENIRSPLLALLVSSAKKNLTVLKHENVTEEKNVTKVIPFINETTVNQSSSPIKQPTSNLNITTQEVEIITEQKIFVNYTTVIPNCPDIPEDLDSKIQVIKTNPASVVELERRFSWLEMGGHYSPKHCKANYKVALVIPYRCRAEHLLLFLQHMHPFLKKQNIDYTIYIIEQFGETGFNRAMLMNVGYTEALKMDDYDCFIFHDIDLLPEDERNLYTCPEQPRHMSVAVDKFNYKLPYESLFGGVSAITTKQFKLLNGFSNSFWGWGGEDDDMANRIHFHNLQISRYPITKARYSMLQHKQEKVNSERSDIFNVTDATDGNQIFSISGSAAFRINRRAEQNSSVFPAGCMGNASEATLKKRKDAADAAAGREVAHAAGYPEVPEESAYSQEAFEGGSKAQTPREGYEDHIINATYEGGDVPSSYVPACPNDYEMEEPIQNCRYEANMCPTARNDLMTARRYEEPNMVPMQPSERREPVPNQRYEENNIYPIRQMVSNGQPVRSSRFVRQAASETSTSCMPRNPLTGAGMNEVVKKVGKRGVKNEGPKWLW